MFYDIKGRKSLPCFWYPELGGSPLCPTASLCRGAAGLLYLWWGTEKAQLLQPLWCPPQASHQGAGDGRGMTEFELSFCRAADGTAQFPVTNIL